MIVKVCGMRDTENIRAVEQLDIQMMGFIFHPRSARYVERLPAYMPKHIRRVGVFVNEDNQHILSIAGEYNLDYIQLHGNEPPCQCRELKAEGLGIIKAFSISDASDLAVCPAYETLCDFFLFDTKTPLYGGSGQSFDWNVLQQYNGKTPFLLSGGISAGDTARLKQFSHPRWAGIDLNSRFETAPGVKDAALLKAFIKQI